MKALTAVAARRVTLRAQAGECSRDRPGFQKQAAQRFAETAGPIVLLDTDYAAFSGDARGELGGDLRQRQHSHAPNFELIEQVRGPELVQAVEDGPHADDDAASARLELSPG